MWVFWVRIFTSVSVWLCVSSVIFLHASQVSMALVSTQLVDCQVRKANMPQEIRQQVNFHSVFLYCAVADSVCYGGV